MKATTRAKKLNEKIQAITRDQSTVLASYETDASTSTQAELRMTAKWAIWYPVDSIHAPKRMDREAKWDNSPWQACAAAQIEINRICDLASGREYKSLPINARTKTGPAQREEARALFEIECAQAFLAAYKQATGIKRLNAVRVAVAGLQAKQKEILKDMRAENSRYLADRKAAKAAEREADAVALKEGRFWDASKEALKGYFHPPFEKNHLADVSEKWRAALYLECESAGWKDYHGNWRHKLVGTDRAYLCGIDDNGDEWGHECRIDLGVDDYGNVSLDADVEDAMAVLFEIPSRRLDNCERQGDLLFCRQQIPSTPRQVCRRCGAKWNPIELGDGLMACDCCQSISEPRTIHPPQLAQHHGPWEVRESHRIEAEGLERNGRWFRSPNPIHVTHTSHHPVMLEPGEYRLYTLQVADAD